MNERQQKWEIIIFNNYSFETHPRTKNGEQIRKMGCSLTTSWIYKGMRTIIMENDQLRVTILPDVGSKIFEFVLKENQRDMLYHNPRVEVRPPVFGVNVDNWWHGGIDDCIPTGQPSIYKGEEYPYLGELWSLPWEFAIEENTANRISVRLWRHTIISPLLVEKWLTLEQNQSSLRIRYKITNLGYSDFQFLWGIHPGLAITKFSRIDIPKSKVIIEESFPNNRLGSRGSSYEWPEAKTSDGSVIDMRHVLPPESQTWDLHHAIGFSEGWLSMTDSFSKSGIGIVFPKEIFKCIWLWLVYGGWRGLYCAAVEAWTGFPGKLDKAVKNGMFSNLGPKQILDCEMKIVCYAGLSKVERIRPDGTVIGD